ncbi:hypothetical protein [Amycolatopsis stemonae]
MVTAPGSGQQLQHYVPPGAKTSRYIDGYAYVAPCTGHPLCIPADARYRSGMPFCPACVNLSPTASRPKR